MWTFSSLELGRSTVGVWAKKKKKKKKKKKMDKNVDPGETARYKS